MMKSGIPVLMVDSIVEAVKFYSEKLAFDIVELHSDQDSNSLDYALLRKGKCYIMFRIPQVEELVEFSQIKHCLSRGSGVYAEMKKGLDKYYNRCKSKGVRIVQELKETPWGDQIFTVKDPFGFKLTFAQEIEGFRPEAENFCGLEVSRTAEEVAALEEMIQYLLGIGISRRASRKFAKRWFKDFLKK